MLLKNNKRQQCLQESKTYALQNQLNSLYYSVLQLESHLLYIRKNQKTELRIIIYIIQKPKKLRTN